MKPNLTYFFEIYSLVHHLPLRSSKHILRSNVLPYFFFIFQLNCIQNHIHPLHLQQCTLDSPTGSNPKVHRFGRNNIQPKRFNKRIVNGSFAPHSEGSNHHLCPQRLVQVYVPNCLEQTKTEIAYYRHKSYRLCRNDKKKTPTSKIRSFSRTNQKLLPARGSAIFSKVKDFPLHFPPTPHSFVSGAHHRACSKNIPEA